MGVEYCDLMLKFELVAVQRLSKMKRIIAYITILILAMSCKSQYYTDASICGTFGGREGGIHRKNPIAYSVKLELNSDHTFKLSRSFDLSSYTGQGEWAMRKDGVIELNCNNNPVVDDVVKALMAGGFIEGIQEVQVLGKNKLKWGDTILKRWR